MIEIKMQVEEVGGQVQVRMDSPPSLNATPQETLHASILCKGIRQAMTEMAKFIGEGTMIERSAVRCPRCGHMNPKEDRVTLYECAGCHRQFGA